MSKSQQRRFAPKPRNPYAQDAWDRSPAYAWMRAQVELAADRDSSFAMQHWMGRRASRQVERRAAFDYNYGQLGLATLDPTEPTGTDEFTATAHTWSLR